jgi:hypothetical protein
MHFYQMALIALSIMGFIDYLGYRTIFMRAMFCSVVLEQKKGFFSHQKSPRCLLGGGATSMI